MRMEQVINHPKLQVEFIRGSEGPEHDPYSFTEIHAKTPHGNVILHEGALVVWLKHDGKKIRTDEKTASTIFGLIVGYTPTQLNRIVNRLQSRCTRCGGRDFETVTGYPGETFEQCVRCKHINASSMDFSAIE